MKRLILTACLLLAGLSLGAQDWGGHYMMEIPEQAIGDLYLVPVSPSEAEFLLVVKRPDGTQIVYDSAGSPIRLEEGSFIWRHPSPEFDYSISFDLNPVNDEGVPVEGSIIFT